MPTYEYACRDCGTHLEVVQSFTDEPLTTCATCGGSLRKVFSAVGITFKGSGFYKTDSRKGSSATTPSTSTSGTSGDAPSTSSGDGAGSSTPATTTTTTTTPAPSTSSGGEAKSA